MSERLRYEGEPVRGSRFIVDIAPATSDDEARGEVKRVAADFPDASHHCSAWRLVSPQIERANDDGEPSGSAGRPILAQLAGRNAVNAVAIVTRYFGGTKLGVGGLVRAYGGATGEALDATTLVPWIAETVFEFEHGYQHTDGIDRILAQLGGSVEDRGFGEHVTVRVRIAETKFDAFRSSVADITSGEIAIPDPD